MTRKESGLGETGFVLPLSLQTKENADEKVFSESRR